MNKLSKEEKIIAALESFTQGGQGTIFNFNAASFKHNYGLDATEKEIERVYKKWENARIKIAKAKRDLCTSI